MAAQVKLGNNGWQQVRVYVQDMARFQVDNAKMRTFSLVRIGPPLVLQVDLVPLSVVGGTCAHAGGAS